MPENPAGWPRTMRTGGSNAIRSSWEPLRKAGATAREMLVTAAAETWKVDRATCRAEQGVVIHVPSRRRLPYGTLAARAASLPVPTDVPLKDPKDFRLVGTRVKRLDTPGKVDGSAQFGIDVKVPGMLIASIERSPVLGGRVKRFNADRAKAMPGVRHVVALEPSSWVGVRRMGGGMRGRRSGRGGYILAGTAGTAGARDRVGRGGLGRARFAGYPRSARRARRSTGHCGPDDRRCDGGPSWRSQAPRRHVRRPLTAPRHARAHELHGARPRRRVRCVGADAESGRRAAGGRRGERSTKGEGPHPHDALGGRVRAQARARLRLRGGPRLSGGGSAREGGMDP